MAAKSAHGWIGAAIVVFIIVALVQSCGHSTTSSSNDWTSSSVSASVDSSAASTTEAKVFPTSFNCHRASGTAEQLICHNEALAKSDKTLAEVYLPLLASLPAEEKAKLIADQKAWIAERSRCVSAAEPEVCLSQQYQVRIINLQLMEPGASQSPNSDGADASASI